MIVDRTTKHPRAPRLVFINQKARNKSGASAVYQSQFIMALVSMTNEIWRIVAISGSEKMAEIIPTEERPYIH